MLQAIYLALIVFTASFIGSLNGLGVSFLLSLALLMFGPNEHASIQWILYSSSLIVASVFVFSRLKLVLENIYQIFLLSMFCGIGVLVGKIVLSHYTYHLLKLTFGIVLIAFSLLLKNFGVGKETISEIHESEVSFSFFDLLSFTLIGFFAGYFDFGIAAFIYIHMFLKNKFYNIERIDICVYCVIILTSVINLLFTLIRFEQVLPSYIGLSFPVFILMGAGLARVVYKMIAQSVRRNIVIFGIFFVGLKILIISLNFVSVNSAIADINNFMSSFF